MIFFIFHFYHHLPSMNYQLSLYYQLSSSFSSVIISFIISYHYLFHQLSSALSSVIISFIILIIMAVIIIVLMTMDTPKHYFTICSIYKHLHYYNYYHFRTSAVPFCMQIFHPPPLPPTPATYTPRGTLKYKLCNIHFSFFFFQRAQVAMAFAQDLTRSA